MLYVCDFRRFYPTKLSLSLSADYHTNPKSEQEPLRLLGLSSNCVLYGVQLVQKQGRSEASAFFILPSAQACLKADGRIKKDSARHEHCAFNVKTRGKGLRGVREWPPKKLP